MDKSEDIKVGVFLARFQPVHKAHIYVIETALKECDKVIILMGSSNKESMLRNPFSFKIRYELLRDSLSNREDMERIEIYELPDWSQEDKEEDNQIWGSYLYYNIVSRIKQKKFSFYYSDKPDIVADWFAPEIRQYITHRFLDRNSIFSGLSSTKIRTAILNFADEDQDYLEQFLPEAVYRRINELRGIWLDVFNNPKPDFTMK